MSKRLRPEDDLLYAWPGMAAREAKRTGRSLNQCLCDFPPTQGKIMQLQWVEMSDGRRIMLPKPTQV